MANDNCRMVGKQAGCHRPASSENVHVSVRMVIMVPYGAGRRSFMAHNGEAANAARYARLRRRRHVSFLLLIRSIVSRRGRWRAALFSRVRSVLCALYCRFVQMPSAHLPVVRFAGAFDSPSSRYRRSAQMNVRFVSCHELA